MSDIAVVHLIYAPFGVAPFQRFVESYRGHSAGAEHELIFAFKAFPRHELPADFSDVVQGVAHQHIFVADGGFDLGSYLAVARSISARWVCFFNSNSEILAAGWLSNLIEQIRKKGVGLVGTTASNESHLAAALRASCSARAMISAIRHPTRIVQLISTAADYSMFPSFHVRTNGFVIARELLLSLDLPLPVQKAKAHQLESGRNSLTSQVLRRGLDVRVVGKDGVGYPPEESARSRTFRSGDQENLLVADNRTREYAAADLVTKRALRQLAWGAAAGC